MNKMEGGEHNTNIWKLKKTKTSIHELNKIS